MSTKVRKKPARWTDDFLLRSYELARDGLKNTEVAEVLNVTPVTFQGWLASKPKLRDAVDRGREVKGGTGALMLRDYIYGKMPEHLKELWDDINVVAESENGIRRVEALFELHGEKARQHLFLYALTTSNFFATQACRLTNVSKGMLDDWCQNDPDFSELLDEIHWHKGNFFESALLNLVQRGDTSAIQMVNRTYNRERGYGDQLKIDVTKEVKHTHTVVLVDDLKLPLETRKSILEAHRGKMNGNGAVVNGRLIDAS